MDSIAPIMIRPACPGDFEAWFLLFETVAREGKWIGAEAPLDKPSRMQDFNRSVDSEQTLSLLADHRGQAVGLLSAQLHRGVVTPGMAVDESCRAQGVGSQLMESCLAWTVKERAHKVSLEVWPHNDAAIALYRKFGFAEEGRRRRHYRRRNGELWDSIIMGLLLDMTSPGCPYS